MMHIYSSRNILRPRQLSRKRWNQNSRRDPKNPEITAFFHDPTFTVSYLVRDPERRSCAIIDSVLDFEQCSGRTSTQSADKLIACINDQDLVLEWIFETHIHADHLSAAPYIQTKLGGRIAAGSNIPTVQKVFGEIFNEGRDFAVDGSQFDNLMDDGEEFVIGCLTGKVLGTPGHSPACLTYVIGDAAFVGDTLFMPDFGTARTDFLGGDAATLFGSIRRILSLPDDTRILRAMTTGQMAATTPGRLRSLIRRRRMFIFAETSPSKRSST